MAPIIESATKLQHLTAARQHKSNTSRRTTTHNRLSLDACLNHLSDELESYINDARELCEIKLEIDEPLVNDTFWGTSEEHKPDIFADHGLLEIKLETCEPNETFYDKPNFECKNAYPASRVLCSPVQSSLSNTETSQSSTHQFNPVSNVLNSYLYDLGETEPRGLKLDTKKPKVNAVLWRVQEAVRIEQTTANERTAISEIDKVLRCRSDVPDIDEKCEITLNPNLARYPAAQRRDMQHQLFRLQNNKASKACRMNKNATKEHLFNDVYEMQKNYERLTRRWAMETAVLAFMDETLANVRASTYVASTL